ncbi:hypothetical protein GALMADRAFT_133543 [Galerina marginata CBS 339.88]|uniref:BTB domain-containing protein n=1 Tax=Galerina marginata (strain CBS 339.88) TaxID=685588 RepID=A0A067TLY5_GALM3|nr:hypothetical protein GALMADRAFT_133543 [Galerina marginata CBS 339.88]
MFLPKDSCDYRALSHDLLQLYMAGSNKIKDEDGFDISIQQQPLDSLRKDVANMWRSRMCSDVHIIFALQPTASYQVMSHRFLLSSRSPYFHRVLALSSNEPSIVQLALPSTHFTRSSFYYILGYLYTGTLKFSGRKYCLATALLIFSGSLYLELTALQELILAEITVEMLHGLYYAFLPDHEYSKLVDGNWTTAVNLGCQCGICARRTPRVLQFALEGGTKNDLLERGAC